MSRFYFLMHCELQYLLFSATTLTPLANLFLIHKSPNSVKLKRKSLNHIQFLIIIIQPHIRPAPQRCIQHDALYFLTRHFRFTLKDLGVATADGQRADGEHQRENASQADAMLPGRQRFDTCQRGVQVSFRLVCQHIQYLDGFGAVLRLEKFVRG